MRNTTPQESKIRDYIHQRKNCYGESDKNSRKAIKIRKNCYKRSFRRVAKNMLIACHRDIENVEVNLSKIVRHSWKKYPDECLLKSFLHKWSDSSRTRFVSNEKVALQKEARKRLYRMKTRYYPY